MSKTCLSRSFGTGEFERVGGHVGLSRLGWGLAREAGQDERSKRDKASNLHPYQPASQRVYAPIDLATLLGYGLLDAVKAGVSLAVLLGQLLGNAFEPSNAAIMVLGLR